MLDDHLRHLCGMEAALKVNDLSERSSRLHPEQPEMVETYQADAAAALRSERGQGTLPPYFLNSITVP